MPSQAKSHDHWIAALHQYAEREGHTDVPAGHIETIDGVQLKLGGWVSTRRYRRGQSPVLDDRLEALPGWRWSKPRRRRRARTPRYVYLVALDQYVAREGHACPPLRHDEIVDGRRVRLGDWVRRRQTKRGQNPRLDAELESRPGWLWPVTRMRGTPPKGLEFFAGHLAALSQYVEREGHACPPQWLVESCDGTDILLGSWVGSRRRQRGQNPELDGLLESMPGWMWDAGALRGKGHTADDWLGALAQYVEREGAATPPQLWVEPYKGREVKLGKWVNTRRERRGRDPDLDARLEEFPGWVWEAPRDRQPVPFHEYHLHLTALDQCIAREGHASPRGRDVEFVHGARVAIGAWVGHRRAMRGNNAELDARLEALPGWLWDGGERWKVLSRRPLDAFEPSLRALDQFIAREGHTRMRGTHCEIVDGVPVRLGTWVYDRRRSRGSNPALDEALESRPEWSWDQPVKRERRAAVARRQAAA